MTIIMPTIAMEALENDKQNPVSSFMNLLAQKIDEAKDMLVERFNYICAQPSSSAKFMYENHTMAGYDGKDIRSALKHGTLALG